MDTFGTVLIVRWPDFRGQFFEVHMSTVLISESGSPHRGSSLNPNKQTRHRESNPGP